MSQAPANSANSANSGSIAGTIGILGSAPAADAIAAACARLGLASAAIDVARDGTLAADSAASLAGCGLLIDVRPEEPGQKAASLQRVEAALPATALVVATAIHRCLSPIARVLARPDNFAGLALASPMDAASLVEIVRLASTSDETVARLRGFLAQIGKKAIVVGDSPGFFTGRVSGAFLNEAMALVGEGVPAALVETAALQAGMGSGPLAMLDEISLKLSDELLHQELHDLEHEAHVHSHAPSPGPDQHLHAGDHAGHHHHGHAHEHEHGHEHGHDHGHHDHGHHDHGHHDHGDEHSHDHQHGDAVAASPKTGQPHKHSHKVKSKRMPEAAVYVMEKMAHGFRRLGREAGAGFYDYEDDGTRALWSGLKAFERRSAKVPAEDIQDRLLFIQALESVRCLQEGVVFSLADANAASVDAWGFPASSGGSIGFIDRLGVKPFVDRAQVLAQRYGERFAPPARLVEMAARNEPLNEHNLRQAG